MLLAKAGDDDFLRSVAEAVMQLLTETDLEGLIGAGRHERSGERTTYRNGYWDGRWTPGSAACNWLIRSAAQPTSSGKALTSHPSWSPGRRPKRPWSQ